jgi:hypothetical protein
MNDNGFLYVAALSPLVAERRYDRPYDEQSPGTLFMPDGSKVCSFSRAFLNAASAEVLLLWQSVA